MEALFLKLVNMSISAGWVVLAVVVLRFVLKKAPKWVRCVLWALVAVRLLCPFSVQSALSLMPGEKIIPSGGISTRAVGGSAAPASPGAGAAESASGKYYDPDFDVSSQATQITETVVPAETVDAGVDLAEILSIVWLCGAAALLCYGLVSFLKLRNKVGASIKLRDNIYLCDYVASPFILGSLKPKIYLPSDLSEEQLDYVLAHENAHLRRKDNLIKPAAFVLLAVYWFNPVIWLAYILLCRDIELACDERVIKDMDAEDKRAYSEALLSCSVPKKAIIVCPVAFGEVGVKERVRSVLSYKKPAFWILIAAVIACAAVAVCLLTNPVEDTQKDYSIQGVSFTYKDVQYDLTEQEQLINAATAAYEVGDHIIVECSTNSGNNYYTVFDTAEARFVNSFTGTNLIWEEDNIYTAVYSFENGVYDYSGNLIGSVEFPAGSYIASLAFEDEASLGLLLEGQLVGIIVTVFDGEAYSTEAVYYPPSSTGVSYLSGTNLLPIFPACWSGRYEMKYDEYGEYGMISGVYVKSIHEETGKGLLFYAAKWDKPLTEDEASRDGEWNFAKNTYLGKSTDSGTYFIYYPSDAQYDINDDGQKIEYETMSAQIDKIRFFGMESAEPNTPDQMTEEAAEAFKLVFDYIGTAKGGGIADAVRRYEYFEDEADMENAAAAMQENYIIDYRIMTKPEKLNADLYVCEVDVYTPEMVNYLDSPYFSSQLRTAYLFAGRIDGELYIFRNVEDIPEGLRKGADLSGYDENHVW